MLNIPEEIKVLFKQDNISIKTQRSLRFSFYDDSVDTLYPYDTLFPDTELHPSEHGKPWLIIGDGQIVQESLELEESLCSDENIRFGACEAAKISFTVADVADDIKNKWFTAELIIGGYALAFGVYQVDDVAIEKDKRFKKVTAYDRMRLFDTDVSMWYDELTFPMTLRDFRKSLEKYIGVTSEQQNLTNDTMMVEKTLDATTLNGKKVLEAICEINGVFGHFDRTGTLKYVTLGYGGIYPEETLFPENALYPGETSDPEKVTTRYKELDYKEWIVQSVERLEIYNEQGKLAATAGGGENRYIIKNNFLVYKKASVDLFKISANTFGNINGRTYKPATVTLAALPYVEVGDLLSIEYKQGKAESFAMKRKTIGIQAMLDIFEATGDEYRSDEFSLQDQVDSLENRTSNIDEGLEDTKNNLTQTTQDLASLRIDTDNFKQQAANNFSAFNSALINETKRAQSAEGTLSSSIMQTTSQIQLEVERAKDEENSIRSQIKLTADEINLSVSQKIDGVENTLRSEIKMTSTSITATVEDKEKKLRSEIQQTANSITITVENKERGLRSEIQQTEHSIRSTVTNTANGLQSQITQQSDRITSVVKEQNSQGTKMSQIEQTANKINFLVKSGTSESNFTMTDKAISLIAKELNISGYVTFSDLSGSGKTTINGSNITTGTIDAKKVTVKNLSASNITSGIIDCKNISVINLNANNITSGSLDVSRVYAGGKQAIGLGTYGMILGVGGQSVIVGTGSVGFFNHAPASRKTVPYPSASTSTLYSLQRLIQALRDYGLIV